MKPIPPSQVAAAKEGIIPNEIIYGLNTEIIKTFNGKLSTFEKDALVATIKKKFVQLVVSDISNCIDENWSDVKILYEDIGWKVFYMADDIFTFSIEFLFEPKENLKDAIILTHLNNALFALENISIESAKENINNAIKEIFNG